MVSSQ
jgi:hypothetical protein